VNALRDILVIARRNVVRIIRVPELMVFVLISPIVFVLLFAYVFGNSIEIEGGTYREFMMAGVFAQTVVFGATFTGTGIADDMQKGIINRFRSLPMSRVAVIAGRTLSDVIYNFLSIVVMAITGLVVGWRVRSSVFDALIGFLLLLLFAYALSWVMAYVALLVPSVEVINNASFIVIFPLTFVANTFVPADDLPTALRVFAEWNPVSAITQAARARFGNVPPGTPEPSAWPLANPELYTVAWSVAIVAIFAPLAIRRFVRTTRR
jgi:ABC transporter DrrB family efflux protein